MTRPDDLDQRLQALERTVRWQRRALLAVAALGAGLALAGFTAGRPDLIETRAIRIVDEAGRPRILIGAPPPAAGRNRTDGQTASLVVLGPNGEDRVILGEEPEPHIGGSTYPRVDAGYGLVIHDGQGSERGAFSFLDNGRGVVALDRPGGDAVALIVNDRSGFAGLTVNYANPIGSYAEGVRIGTHEDEAWLSLQDRPQTERARLSVAGDAAPALISRPAANARSAAPAR